MLLSEAASSWRPASCAGGTSSSFWLDNGGVNQWSICREQQQCKACSKAAGQSHGGLTESIECLEPAAGGPEAVLGEALVREPVHCGSFRSATATWSGKRRKRGVAKIVGERARNAFAGRGHISYLHQRARLRGVHAQATVSPAPRCFHLRLRRAATRQPFTLPTKVETCTKLLPASSLTSHAKV